MKPLCVIPEEFREDIKQSRQRHPWKVLRARWYQSLKGEPWVERVVTIRPSLFRPKHTRRMAGK